MSSAQLFHNTCNVLVLVAANCELYRIHKGIHPYWTPKLEVAGLVKARQRAVPQSSNDGSAAVMVGAGVGSSEASLKWTNLNAYQSLLLQLLCDRLGQTET